MNLDFPNFFRKILEHQISWKSVHWDPSCFTWKNGRADMMKLIHVVAFLNFTDAPKNITYD